MRIKTLREDICNCGDTAYYFEEYHSGETHRVCVVELMPDMNEFSEKHKIYTRIHEKMTDSEQKNLNKLRTCGFISILKKHIKEDLKYGA